MRSLEQPRPFPAALRPLLRAVAGSADRPRYTAGPATRQALLAAGARGASTGSVVHLSAPPPATLPGRPPASRTPAATFEVIAHELAHLRHPLPRTRFLLAGGHSGADLEERAAHAVGHRMRAVVAGGPIAAGIVGDLPVAGAAGRVTDLRDRADDDVTGTRTADRGTSTSAAADPDAGSDTAVDNDIAEPAAGDAASSHVVSSHAASQPRATAGPTNASTLDIDRVVLAVEERLLRQIERRGGRYAGMF